ncbi:MAG TPA: hypothetical protein VHI71_04030 [Actinomycetota bacterium]|nr:hypothetical protein [Actinomycetota bacterium]
MAQEPGRASHARPRWVKVAGIAALVVMAVVVVVMLATGGEHGPGRHLPGRDAPAGHTPPVDHGG